MTRAEWLAERAKIAAVLPRLAKNGPTGAVVSFVSIEELMAYEGHGPCPPEPPSLTIGNSVVTFVNGEYLIARTVFDAGHVEYTATRELSAVGAAIWCAGRADDETVTRLLALRGAK